MNRAEIVVCGRSVFVERDGRFLLRQRFDHASLAGIRGAHTCPRSRKLWSELEGMRESLLRRPEVVEREVDHAKRAVRRRHARVENNRILGLAETLR